MHPLLQDFLAVVMDTMTMHINPQYKYITMFYWSARLSCCLQKSIAKSLSRKYSASNGLAAKGLHFNFSHPHRELSIEQDLTLLSIGVALYAWDDDTYSSRYTRSPSPLTKLILHVCTYISDVACSYNYTYTTPDPIIHPIIIITPITNYRIIGLSLYMYMY